MTQDDGRARRVLQRFAVDIASVIDLDVQVDAVVGADDVFLVRLLVEGVDRHRPVEGEREAALPVELVGGESGGGGQAGGREAEGDPDAGEAPRRRRRGGQARHSLGLGTHSRPPTYTRGSRPLIRVTIS